MKKKISRTPPLYPINADAYNDRQAAEIGHGILELFHGQREEDGVDGADVVEAVFRLIDDARKNEARSSILEWAPMCAYCLNPETEGHQDDCDRPGRK